MMLSSVVENVFVILKIRKNGLNFRVGNCKNKKNLFQCLIKPVQLQININMYLNYCIYRYKISELDKQCPLCC